MLLCAGACRQVLSAQGAQGSPVTEAIAAAVSRTAGVALGGAATFIPLLERCGTVTLLQARRAPVQATSAGDKDLRGQCIGARLWK